MSDSTRQGDLPDGWVWTTIGQIADTTRKRVNPQNHPALPFVGMEHVESHTMRITTTVSSKDMRSSAEYFEPGDVLYGRLRPYLNKVFCAEFTGLCSGEFIPFRKTNHVASKYLLYFLNSWEFVSFASHLNEGDRPRVSFDQLASYPFPLAPLPEQQRIVAAIETQFTRLDAAVAALQRVQANLRRYRAAVLKAACEGRLVPTEAVLARQAGRTYEPADVLLARILAGRQARWEAEHPGKRYVEPAGPRRAEVPALPEGWCRTTIGSVFDVTIGGTPQRSKPEYWNGDLAWVSSGEVQFSRIRSTRESITQDGLVNSNTKLLPPGTVLLAMIGEGRTRGQAAILDVEATTNQNVAAILCSRTPILPEWLFFWLQARYEVTRKSGSGGMQYALNSERIRGFAHPLPPLAEQQRIVAEVERRLSVVAEVEAAVAASVARAARLRQAVLKRAFAGRLVP